MNADVEKAISEYTKARAAHERAIADEGSAKHHYAPEVGA